MMTKREFEVIRNAIQNGKKVTVQFQSLPNSIVTDPIQVVSCGNAYNNVLGVPFVTVKHDNPGGGTVSHHPYSHIHSYSLA